MSNWINDDIFNDNFRLNHPNDYSLVCQNNVLYYSGDTKIIAGMITVNSNSSVKLGKYRITSLNPNQWKMEPYQLFFFIKESVILIDIDKNQYIGNIRNSLLKDDLKENEKFNLDYLVDYYSALKTIESYLSGDLYDTFNSIKKVLFNTASKNELALTESETYIYNKIYDIFQKEINSQNNENNSSNSESNSRGVARVQSLLPKGVHFSEPSDNSEKAAFISVCILVVLILAIVVGSLTYLLS